MIRKNEGQLTVTKAKKKQNRYNCERKRDERRIQCHHTMKGMPGIKLCLLITRNQR